MFFLEALNFKTQFNNPFNWGLTLSEKEIRESRLNFEISVHCFASMWSTKCIREPGN